MLPHAVAVAPDIDDVTVVNQTIDESSGHDFVAQDLAPLFEALVGGKHGTSVLVAPVDELEKSIAPVCLTGRYPISSTTRSEG